MYGRVKLVAPYRVAVGLVAVRLTSSGGVHGIMLKALCPGQTIYIGADANVTTANGYPLGDQESIPFEVANANVLYAIADVAAQSVAVLPFYRN